MEHTKTSRIRATIHFNIVVLFVEKISLSLSLSLGIVHLSIEKADDDDDDSNDESARARKKREGIFYTKMWTLFFERVFCFFYLGFSNLGFYAISEGMHKKRVGIRAPAGGLFSFIIVLDSFL